MRITLSKLPIFAIAVAFALLIAAQWGYPPTASAGHELTFGTTVSGDLFLEHDLVCSPGFTGNALTVTADGITIDGVTGTLEPEKEAG